MASVLTRRRTPFLAAALLLLGAGQAYLVGTRLGATEPTPAPSPTPSSTALLAVPSDTARKDLCHRKPSSPAQDQGRASLPAPLQTVADQVEEIRGLRFTRPVHPDPITHEQLVKGIGDSVDRSYPEEQMRRRTMVWRAIGVIPSDGDLRKDVEGFAGGSVIGYYDTATHELVFIGSGKPTPFERVTLAHELTHALDDQHFNLNRLDQLDGSCSEEELAAGVGLAEGDARLTELTYVTKKLTEPEYREYVQQAVQGGTAPTGLSPFVFQLLVWPYPNGQRFVQQLVARGGYDAVNDAFRHPPASTEQILHPERYPSDEQQDVDVPDARPSLGKGWEQLDVYDVGEEWLRLMLELRLPTEQAAGAAAGWDGGEYRAWSDGDRVAVWLRTVWDSPQEAGQFRTAAEDWLARTRTGEVSQVQASGSQVDLFFAPDGTALKLLVNAPAAL